jgi:hypothetical protein
MEAAQAAGDRFDECMREEWKINAPEDEHGMQADGHELRGRVGSVSLLAECSWSDQDRRSSALFSVQGTACSRQVK